MSELSAFEVETSIEKLKRNKSPGIAQILAELIKAGVEQFILRSVTLLFLFQIRRNCLRSGRSLIFLKLHTYHSLNMPYNRYKFGCDRSITKGILLEEQSTFSTVYRILFKGSYCNSTSNTHCACPTIGISLDAIGQ